MPYACWCMDVEESASIRQNNLSEHLSYIEQNLDRVLAAGPLTDEQGTRVGSLFIYDTDDEAEARQLLNSDPYALAHVWHSHTLLKFSAAAGTWCGGLSWRKS